ncbi:phage tail tube protein [Bacillus sp. JJ722]|uniref:phage tail tube protein n=1 Tax=Bacillus sp. JJ722 TaxID=3122973 RepID=UPI003000E2EC
MSLDTTRVINGTFGTVYHEGNWVMNAKSAEAIVEINKEEVPIAGTRWIGHKVTSLTGTGSISMYKVTSEFIVLIGSIAQDDGKPYVTELIFKLADPESFGAERIRLKGVQFDQIPLGKFEVNAIVEDELPFTFSGYELLDKIEQA